MSLETVAPKSQVSVISDTDMTWCSSIFLDLLSLTLSEDIVYMDQKFVLKGFRSCAITPPSVLRLLNWIRKKKKTQTRATEEGSLCPTVSPAPHHPNKSANLNTGPYILRDCLLCCSCSVQFSVPDCLFKPDYGLLWPWSCMIWWTVICPQKSCIWILSCVGDRWKEATQRTTFLEKWDNF